MKFQKYDAFENHFTQSFPEHLSAVYLIIQADEQERKQIFHTLVHKLKQVSDFQKFYSLEEALVHLSNGSLFFNKVSALYDGVEELTDKEQERLLAYLQHPNPVGHLILGAKNSKNVAELYQKGKKELVLLDLSQEKPWDQLDRFKKWVVQLVIGEKKQITPDAVEALFERIPPDRALLQNEMEKLLSYIGERKQITRKDVEALCSPSQELNLFKTSEQLIWGGLEEMPDCEPLSILGLMRYQLEMGLKMACLLKRGESETSIGARFPKVRPKQLQNYLLKAHTRGIDYFKRGLLSLFDLEWKLKSSQGDSQQQLTLFYAKLGENS